MSESSVSPTANPIEEPTLSELERVEQLLNPKTPETEQPAPAAGGDTNTGDPEDPEKAPETEPPESEAEPPATVDYTQEIPLSNGQKITLGELKDFYQAQDVKLVELMERENQVMAQYRELQEVSQFLQLPPEHRERIAQQQREYMQTQHGLMMAAIPEWKDQAVFEKSRAAIFDLGKEYQVDLSQVMDHKVVKMLHDFARLKGAIKSVKANVKPVRTVEPKAIPRGVAVKPTELSEATARARQTGNVNDQMRAVDLLLKG